MKSQNSRIWIFTATVMMIVSLVFLCCGDTGELDIQWIPSQGAQPSDGTGEEGSGQTEIPSLPDEALRLLPEELVGSYTLVSAQNQGVTLTTERSDQEDGVPTRAEGSLLINADGTYQIALALIEDDDCRGVKECLDGRCMLPEMLQIWERSPLCENDDECSSPLGCFGGRCTTHEVFVHVNGHPAP